MYTTQQGMLPPEPDPHVLVYITSSLTWPLISLLLAFMYGGKGRQHLTWPLRSTPSLLANGVMPWWVNTLRPSSVSEEEAIREHKIEWAASFLTCCVPPNLIMDILFIFGKGRRVLVQRYQHSRRPRWVYKEACVCVCVCARVCGCQQRWRNHFRLLLEKELCYFLFFPLNRVLSSTANLFHLHLYGGKGINIARVENNGRTFEWVFTPLLFARSFCLSHKFSRSSTNARTHARTHQHPLFHTHTYPRTHAHAHAANTHTSVLDIDIYTFHLYRFFFFPPFHPFPCIPPFWNTQ